MSKDVLELAGCVLLDSGNQILLLHRNTNQYDHWEIPGGKLEPGETASAAAIREMREELDVAVMIQYELGEASFWDRRAIHYRWFIAIAEGKPQVAEPDKFDDLAYFSIAELGSGRLSLSEGAKCLVDQLKTGKIKL